MIDANTSVCLNGVIVLGTMPLEIAVMIIYVDACV